MGFDCISSRPLPLFLLWLNRTDTHFYVLFCILVFIKAEAIDLGE